MTSFFIGEYKPTRPDLNCEKIPQGVYLDLLVIPGIAFHTSGYRVGYGKGFYDRFMESLPDQTVTVGLAYDFQVIDSEFPIDEWDVPISTILTEKREIQRR